MIAIRFEHINMVQHNIGNGITEPKLAITDNNIPVIVKTYNGPEGQLVLFNEYLCYRLATLLDIPMPESGICLIDTKTTIYNQCVAYSQLGYGFYSTYIHKSTPLVDTIIPMMKNKEVFYQVLLFDHVIFNTDRNIGNLLVQYYKNSIILQVIDHTHVFVNQAIWDANCLDRAIKEKDYFSRSILENNSYLYGLFFSNMSVRNENLANLKKVFKARITESRIREFISEMPEEWIPTKNDIDALIRYILYRIEHLDDICITILEYLKN